MPMENKQWVISRQSAFSFFVYLFCLLVSLCLFPVLYAQEIDFKYNEHLWRDIVLSDRHNIPETSDTMLVLCSVREFDSLSTRFFKDHLDPHGRMHYLLAVWKKAHWTLYRMNSLESAASFLRPGNDVVFYIEGMGKTFTTNLYRGAGFAVQYQVNTILFDYPSADPSYHLLANFQLAMNNSAAVYLLYTQLLYSIKKSKEENLAWIKDAHVTLFHHSMGNRMLEASIRKGSLEGLKDSLVHTIVLNAACVRSRYHHQWIEKINFAPEIIIIYNKQDRQLKGAGWCTLQRQLGNSPKPPFAARVVYVDFNGIAGKQHNLFLNKPGGSHIPNSLYDFYSIIFHGDLLEWKNSHRFYITRKIPGYGIR